MAKTGSNGKPAKGEVWQRGPVYDVPALLQPVAHALLQAKEEVISYAEGFPDQLLWIKPGGMASVGFHLQHLAGVIDRLFTYALGKALSEDQHSALLRESCEENVSVKELTDRFIRQVDGAVGLLKNIEESSLKEVRYVGRAKIESTQIGLLFHSAEHTMRHVGQLMVTMRFVKYMSEASHS